MNLTTNYIEEVYKEISIPNPEWDDKNRDWVHAYYRTNCCGNEQDKDMIYPVERWEEIKEKGYYIG